MKESRLSFLHHILDFYTMVITSLIDSEIKPEINVSAVVAVRSELNSVAFKLNAGGRCDGPAAEST